MSVILMNICSRDRNAPDVFCLLLTFLVGMWICFHTHTHTLTRHAVCERDISSVERIRICLRRGSQSTNHLFSFLVSFFYWFSSSASRYHCDAICRIIKRFSTPVPSLFLSIIYIVLVRIDVKIFNHKTNCSRIDRTTSSMTMNVKPAQKKA